MFALWAITRALRPTRRTRPGPEPLVRMTAESAAALPMTTTLTTPPETRPSRKAARWPRRPLSAGDSDRPAITSSYAPAAAAAVTASRAARRVAPRVPAAGPVNGPGAAGKPPGKGTRRPPVVGLGPAGA